MAQSNTLHIRVDDDLLAAVDAVAARTGTHRSQVVRALLRQSLGEAERTVVEEAMFTFSRMRRVIAQRIGARIGEELPEIMNEVLAVAAE